MATVQVNGTDVKSPREIKQTRTRIFIAVIIAVLGVAAVLLFVRVDHVVEGRGFVASTRHVELRSPAQATIVTRQIEPGQMVQAGQVILLLDQPALAAEHRAAVALLAREQAALDALLAERAGPSAPPQPAPTNAEPATADPQPDITVGMPDPGDIPTAILHDPQLDAARAALHYAQTHLAEIQAREDALTITAPASGVVLYYGADLGTTLAPGQLVAEIYDPLDLQLQLRVRESDSGLLQPGQPCEITLIAAGDHEPIAATLAHCSDVIRPADGGGYREATATLADGPDDDTRVGGSVTARITVGRTSILGLILNP